MVPHPLFAERAHLLARLLQAANRGDTCAMVEVGEIYMEDSVVAGRLAFRGLVLLAEMAAAGFVAFQGVQAHQLGVAGGKGNSGGRSW